MKFNIFGTILLILGLNINILAGEGNATTGGTNGCHDALVSSEFFE